MRNEITMRMFGLGCLIFCLLRFHFHCSLLDFEYFEQGGECVSAVFVIDLDFSIRGLLEARHDLFVQEMNNLVALTCNGSGICNDEFPQLLDKILSLFFAEMSRVARFKVVLQL